MKELIKVISYWNIIMRVKEAWENIYLIKYFAVSRFCLEVFLGIYLHNKSKIQTDNWESVCILLSNNAVKLTFYF